MGDGRARSDKIMLPETMMDDSDELRRWLARSFRAAALLPKKTAKAAKPAKPSKTAKAKRTKR
jgi:hypothetical protein